MNNSDNALGLDRLVWSYRGDQVEQMRQVTADVMAALAASMV